MRFLTACSTIAISIFCAANAHAQVYGYSSEGFPLCAESYDPNVSNVDGWGWQDTTGNSQANSCKIQHQYGYNGGQYSQPYCSEGYTPIASEQSSGWGWEDTDLDGEANSCVLSHIYGYTAGGFPLCAPSYNGSNTSGYGWQDTNSDGAANSCYIQASAQHQWGLDENGTPYCSPTYSGPNTDGYGWEDTDNVGGANSCLIQTTSTTEAPFTSCINLGSDFEVPVGETWRTQTTTTDINRIYNAGFDAIRIPVKWSDRASNSFPYTISSSFFTELDVIIDHALSKNDFKVILDVHHYDELMADPNGQEQRFKKIWEQIASHYQNYSENLIFEVINEPFIDSSNPSNNQMNIARIDRLNGEILNIIRQDNPNRWVIVGGGQYGNLEGYGEGLVSSSPPSDSKIMVTFHYYLPFNFTHQGATWATCWDNSGNPIACSAPVYWGTAGDLADLDTDMDLAETFRDSVGHPLLVGEFGVHGPASGGGAPVAERAEWISAVREASEDRNFAWCNWDYQSSFAAWNNNSNAWISQVKSALTD